MVLGTRQELVGGRVQLGRIGIETAAVKDENCGVDNIQILTAHEGNGGKLLFPR